MSRPDRLPRASLIAWSMTASFVVTACATTPADEPVRHDERVERAQEGLAEDPRIRARVSEVDAARAREEGPGLVEEVEVRVGGSFVDEERVRVTGRVPIKRPAELDAERSILRAETEIAVSRLEAASLERRAELCFPAVVQTAQREKEAIFDAFASRQSRLLEWNAHWRERGMIDELSSARFELEARRELATRQPAPLGITPEATSDVGPLLPHALPEIGLPGTSLVRDEAHVAETVRRHHPSVAVRRATEGRYDALVARARARGQPWIKFVDVSYDYESGGGRSNGVGGRLAFTIPLGGRQSADVDRYSALARTQRGETDAIVEDETRRSLQALADLYDFETRSEEWSALEALGEQGEEVADRWWQQRLARPARVAALLDEAFRARLAVVEARERAGLAACVLLRATGVPIETWPRE